MKFERMTDNEMAEEYANKHVPTDTFGFRSLNDVHYDVSQSFLAGLKAGRKEFAELKEENEKLKEKLEAIEKTRDYWKNSSFDCRHECTSKKSFKAEVKAQRQLAKAKELIYELSSSLSVVGECEEEECELLNRAEQFLNSNLM